MNGTHPADPARSRVDTAWAELRVLAWGSPPTRLPWSVPSRLTRVAVGVGLVALVIMVSTAVGQLSGSGAPLAAAYALGALQTLPLLVVTRAPLFAWRVMALGLLVGTLNSTQPSPHWPWPVASCIAYAVVYFVVVLCHGRIVSVGAGLVTLGAAVLPAMKTVELSLTAFEVTAAVLVALLALADNIRGRIAAQRDLARQEELRRGDQARQAVLAERARIARELHDVVAHHLSMIAIQAEAAPYRLDGLSESARETFQAIRAASTTGLTEMRRIIGLLRAEGEEAERVPQPGLDRLVELVGQVREAGMAVDLTMTGGPRSLPVGIDVSAYRIVQEALSNAGRHAPGARVQVEVAHEPDLLRVRIANARPPAAHAPMLPQPMQAAPGSSAGAGGSPTAVAPRGAGDATVDCLDDTVTAAARTVDSALGAAPPLAAPGGGHGLVGMRERVAMLGGQLRTGPLPRGGFEVVATFPVAAEPADVVEPATPDLPSTAPRPA